MRKTARKWWSEEDSEEMVVYGTNAELAGPAVAAQPCERISVISGATEENNGGEYRLPLQRTFLPREGVLQFCRVQENKEYNRQPSQPAMAVSFAREQL